MLYNSSVALELTQVLFVCSLSSHSLDCISCSYEKKKKKKKKKKKMRYFIGTTR